jgi:hypothetical protein
LARFGERFYRYRQTVLLKDLATSFQAWQARAMDFTKTYSSAAQMASQVAILGSLRAPLVRYRRLLEAAIENPLALRAGSPEAAGRAAAAVAAAATARNSFAIAMGLLSDDRVRLEADVAAFSPAQSAHASGPAGTTAPERDGEAGSVEFLNWAQNRAAELRRREELLRARFQQAMTATALPTDPGAPAGAGDLRARVAAIDGFIKATLRAYEESFASESGPDESLTLVSPFEPGQGGNETREMPVVARLGRTSLIFRSTSDFEIAHFACGASAPSVVPTNNHLFMPSPAAPDAAGGGGSRFIDGSRYTHIWFVPPRIAVAERSPCDEGGFTEADWRTTRPLVEEWIDDGIERARFDGVYDRALPSSGFKTVNAYVARLRGGRLRRARQNFADRDPFRFVLGPWKSPDKRFYGDLAEYVLDNLRPELAGDPATTDLSPDDPRFLAKLAEPMRVFWQKSVEAPTREEWSAQQADFVKLVRESLVPALSASALWHCRDPYPVEPGATAAASCEADPDSFRVFNGVLLSMRSEAQEYWRALRLLNRAVLAAKPGVAPGPSQRPEALAEAIKADRAFWEGSAIPFLDGFAIEQKQGAYRFVGQSVVDAADGSAGRYDFAADKLAIASLYAAFGIDSREMPIFRLLSGEPLRFQVAIDAYWRAHGAQSALAKGQAKVAIAALFGLERLLSEKLFYLGWLQSAEIGERPSTSSDFEIEAILGSALAQLRAHRAAAAASSQAPSGVPDPARPN